jgi:hypothetical protein
MKPFIAFFFIPFLCSACVHHKGVGWSTTSFGTDASRYTATAEKLEIIDMVQSKSLQIVADTIKEMWQNYLIAEGLKFALGEYYGHEGKLVDASTKIKLEELRNAASVAEAEAALKVLQATPAL